MKSYNEFLLMVFGLIVFLLGNTVQDITSTSLDYSTLGAFVFVAGLVLYLKKTKKV